MTDLRVPDVDGMDVLGAALEYIKNGWYVLPVRRGTKNPGSVVGAGWHEQSSRDPQQVTAWFAAQTHGIALHVGRSGAVVFDVDDPDAAGLTELLAELDAVNAPVQSTRSDGTRRHYLVRMPEGRRIGNSAASVGVGKVDVRGDNGVIVVAPSSHPESTRGGAYSWLRGGAVPQCRPAEARLVDSAGATVRQPDAVRAARWEAFPDGDMCAVMRSALDGLNFDHVVGSRYEAARDLTERLAHLGSEGHSGAREAITALRARYLAAVAGERRDTVTEWERQLAGGIDRAVQKRETVRLFDTCAPVAQLVAPPPPSASLPLPVAPAGAPMVSEGRSLDDIGNGERLYDLAGAQFRYVGDQKMWREWDGSRWVEDSVGHVQEAAKIAARNLWKEADAADPGPMAVERDVEAAMLAGDAVLASRIQKEWLTETEEGRKWKAASDRAAHIRKWARDSQMRSRMEAGIAMFTSIPGVATRSVEFDRHPHLFNTVTGTLDTDTGVIRGHDPADLITRVSPARLIEGAPAPLWRGFLDLNLPDPDTRRYLQKLAGYSLTGRANEKLLAYLYGPSDTGKSIVSAVLLAVHGERDGYGYQAPKGALAPRRHGDEGRDPDRHGMIGKRFVVTSETRPGEPMDEALVKSLTGRDTQNTRGNYSKGNTPWTPEMLLMVCSNQYPRITGDDDAIWTRIKVIPFLQQFLAGDPRRDERLQEKILRDELDGVMAWCVEGLRLYLAEGLVTPAEVVMATDQFRASGDGVARWLAEGAEDGVVRIAPTEWTERKFVFKAYETWCSESGITSGLNAPRLYARLESLGYTITARRGKRGFLGIGVTSPWLVSGAPLQALHPVAPQN